MKFKKLLSLCLAFVLSFCFVFSLPLRTVFAVQFAGFDFYNSEFSLHQSDILNTLSSLDYNESFDLSQYYCFISAFSDGSIFLLDKSSTVVGSFSGFPDYYSTHYYSIVFTSSGQATFRNSVNTSINISDLSSYDFSNLSYNSSYSCDVVLFSVSGGVGKVYDATDSSPGKAYTFYYSAAVVNYSFNLIPSFSPLPSDSYQLTGFIVGSDTSMEAFYQWIIDNNKLSELPSYIVSSKLKSLIDFYHNYGGSLTSFIHYLPQWLSFVSLPSQTQENANILKNKLDSLYSEFINQYIVTVTRDRSQELAHHRYGIHTVTDDSDTSLITDDVNDDTITYILRDILRGVIQITNSIYDNTSALIEKIDSINFTATVVNNGGVPSGTDINPLLQKMDDIIEALQADTVSVEIDQTTQDDTDQFLSDWADEFSVELDSKFPVINQLGTLFSDDFFEKCGIDTDGDGEVYEYYNPEVALSRSAPAGSESGIVSDFLNQFDDSDPAFLDNVSFSESVPDWSVSIAGSKVSVFSFKLYAKYRTWIHTIISFIIWTCFLLGLYKSLPGLIGNVANTFDVSHDIFDDKTASK